MTPQTPNRTASEPAGRPNKCRQCEERITRRAATGRPPTYCSSACRRAAGFEVRRLNDHIGRLERELSEWRMLPPATPTLYQCTAADRCTILGEEIGRQQARLRCLLGD